MMQFEWPEGLESKSWSIAWRNLASEAIPK